MKDTLETNLPEEAGKLEETKKPVETPEIDATAYSGGGRCYCRR